MTDYGPTDNAQAARACTHCWHTDTGTTMTLSVWPPVTPRVCCFCGLRELYRPPAPPIPEGHGPYYPQPYGTGTWPYAFTQTGGVSHVDQCACNPKNGGSGICGCTLGGPTITSHG